MRRFTALELIEIGESGASLGSAGRALLLLEAGGMSRDAAAMLPLGMRDHLLFASRAHQFGARLDVGQRCAACGADYEFGFTAADVGRDTPGEAVPPATVEGIAIRAITAGDLVASEGQGSTAAARALLRGRVAPGGEALDDETLDAALAALDPDAELVIAARCPECGQAADIAFDIAAFFWDEILLRIPRLLQQVADLARINHWTERDILSLPPARRRFYLTAAGA